MVANRRQLNMAHHNSKLSAEHFQPVVDELNPWLSILYGRHSPDAAQNARQPSKVHRMMDGERSRIERTTRTCYLGAKLKKDKLIPIISTLLYVCGDAVKIYNVLKYRGLLKKTDDHGELSVRYIKDMTATARQLTGIKYVPPRVRVIELLTSGMDHWTVADRLGLNVQSVKNIKYELRRK